MHFLFLFQQDNVTDELDEDEKEALFWKIFGS